MGAARNDLPGVWTVVQFSSLVNPEVHQRDLWAPISVGLFSHSLSLFVYSTLIGLPTLFPCGSAAKESACNAGDLGLIPGLGRSPGERKGYPLQYSGLENSVGCIAWKIPWTEEPGRLQSMGSLRVRYNWATSLSLFTFMHWRRKWQPTPVFLPGESQGQRSLVGCHLWGHRCDLAAAAAV